MQMNEADFNIQLNGNTLAFSGNLEKSDYSKVSAFLKSVDNSQSNNKLTLDFQQLTFLNSSGIRCIATFIMGSPKQFDIRINRGITWQTENIPTLTCLKPDAIKIL